MRALIPFWVVVSIALFVSDTHASADCIDPTSGLPRGQYHEPDCRKRFCISGEFAYSEAEDRLFLQGLVETADSRITWPGKTDENTPPDKRLKPGMVSLANACDLVEKGFTIGFAASREQGAHFMLTPAEPESGTDLIKKKEIQEEEAPGSYHYLSPHMPYAFAPILMSDDLQNSFHKSCKKIRYFEQADLVVANCPKGGNALFPTIAPNLKFLTLVLATNSAVNFFVENGRKGLTLKHGFFDPRFTTGDLNAEPYLKPECERRGLQVTQFLGSYACFRPGNQYMTELAKKTAELHLLIDDSDHNYALAYQELDRGSHIETTLPAWLLGINDCLQHDLKIGYEPYHNRIFCEHKSTEHVPLEEETVTPEKLEDDMAKADRLRIRRGILADMLEDDDEDLPDSDSCNDPDGDGCP